MNAREKVSLQEFTMETTLSPEAIRESGQRAAEVGTRFMGSKVVEHVVSGSVISYVINGGNLSSTPLMELAVGWEELEGGKRVVTLEVGDDFATKRWVLWGFIPVTPKSPSAMDSLKLFSARLRKELSWTT